MRLEAISAGPEAETDRFDGVVHSVFRHACNIAIDGSGLLTLLAAGRGNQPRGIRIATSEGFDFRNWLRGGQMVGCRAGVLRAHGSPLSLDLRRARPWEAGLIALEADLARPKSRRAWSQAWRGLRRWGTRDGMGAVLADDRREIAGASFRSTQNWSRTLGCLVGRRIAALVAATRARDADMASAAAACLVGLGPGLTPAGDDFIVGYLAGLWSTTAGDITKRTFVQDFAARVRAAARNTTDISRSFIIAAAHGQVSEPLAILAASIAGGEAPEVVGKTARAAIVVGATSGADGVLGLLLGLVAAADGDG